MHACTRYHASRGHDLSQISLAIAIVRRLDNHILVENIISISQSLARLVVHSNHQGGSYHHHGTPPPTRPH